MNAFGITQKSISFFLNMFYQHNDNENGIRKFVEVEYAPNDRDWAFEKFKTEKLKKVV
tara:strand:- start:41 stop:214 length:174 start_codon:yes stop_codon:yes gene_type:complete